MTSQFPGGHYREFLLADLRRLTPEQRLSIAFELSEAAKRAWLQELRQRFPNATDAEFRAVVKEQLERRAQEELRIYYSCRMKG
jgi:hypothetical protein